MIFPSENLGTSKQIEVTGVLTGHRFSPVTNDALPPSVPPRVETRGYADQAC